MLKSALLTTRLVEQAIEIARPSIENLIQLDLSRNVIYVVVLDPVAALSGTYDTLWMGAIGEQDRGKWARRYDQFATFKANVSLRTKMPSHLVQRNAPYLYVKGDFKYGGSEYHDGIIVAASGLAWEHDYAVSSMIAGLCHALSIGAFEVEYAKKDCLFIGDETPASN